MWSAYQQAIFEAASQRSNHLLVNAVAGSGKSTTLVEAGRHLHTRAVYTAFAKANVTDLTERVESRHTVLTLHKMGRDLISQRFGMRAARINGDREKNYVVDNPRLFKDKAWSVSSLLRAVAAYKNQGFNKAQFLAWVDQENIFALDEDETEVNPIILDDFRAAVRDVLEWSRDDRTTGVSFDDMIWLPYILDLSWKQFQCAIVDEVQDLNVVQLHLATASAERIVAAGDPWQAIYAFRGAASDSFDRLREALTPIELPLSVCYRCSTSVIDAVRARFKLHIEAHDAAPVGSVTQGFLSRIDVQSDDVFLSRSNRGLGFIAGRLAKRGVPFTLTNLQFIETELDKLKQKTVGDAVTKLKKLKLRPSTEFVFGLLEAADESETIENFVRRMRHVLAPRTGVPLLTTVHRFKGREAKRVHVLVSSFGPQSETEERNLLYVAMTRSRVDLVLLQDQL